MKTEMEILLNNRKESIDKDELSLAELIKIKNFTFKLLVIFPDQRGAGQER